MAVSYAYWSKGDNENSTKAIEEAYKISPDDPGVLSNLAYNYCELKKFDDALRLTIVGLKKTDLGNDWKANLLRNQGFAYLGLEQYEMAILSLNKSIELNPSNSFAYYFRALSNIGLNKTDSVCNDLKKSYENGGINLTSDLIKIYCKK
jgi:tetratricopeptide (TPR) repeat protein